MNYLKNAKIYLLLVFSFLLSYPSYAQINLINNTLQKILSLENKINLSLVREWSSEATDDDQKAFYLPRDIKIDVNGLYYIIDSGNNRIQVFDSLGNYIRTLGREGKGPGDFALPNGLAFDKSNNLIISDAFNKRIQILDSTGKYIDGFKINSYGGRLVLNRKNEIILPNSKKLSDLSAPLFLLYNNHGKLVGKIGKNRYKKNNLLEGVYFKIDKQDNIYASYFAHPYIEKYSSKGELILEITYEMPFKVNYGDKLNNGSKIRVERLCYGLAIDNKDRIYLITTTRLKTKNERKIGRVRGIRTRDGRDIIMPVDHGFKTEHTDLYRLLVFDNSGKIIASKRLNVYCENLEVYKDKLFIIDTFVGMKIYEYKISFE